MGIFARMLINIKRYKGRTLILFATTFLIGTLIAATMLMNQATHTSIQQLQRSMPLLFSTRFDANWDSLALESAEDSTLLTREMLYEIGVLPYVAHFDYTLLWSLMGGYRRYFIDGFPDGVVAGDPDEFDTNSFTIHGVSDPEIIYFEHGMYELVEGRLFAAEELKFETTSSVAPILVSREFAEFNELSVGSLMNLNSTPIFVLPEDADVPEGGFVGMEWGEDLWNHPYNQVQEIIYEFKIVGIFDFTRILRGNISELIEHESRTNTFFTPNWRVHEAMSDYANAWQLGADVFNMHDWEEGLVSVIQAQANAITPLWLLNDLDDVAAFTEAANQILPPSLEIDEGLVDTFRPMIEATNNLNTIVSQVLWLASGAMVIVLTLLIILYLRERKHEIGIYLALGENKIKIVLQLLLEIIIVSAFGLIMAFFTANMLSEELSLSMLQTELVSNERSDNHIPDMLELLGFGQALTEDEMLAFFEVSLEMEAVMLFFLVGLGTVTLSTVVPVVYILELNPKDILMKAKIE